MHVDTLNVSTYINRMNQRRGGLADEIQQSKPFDSARSEAYLNILRSASILEGRVSLLIREYGISQPQYNVLRILRGAGPEGLPCGEIASRMITREPDISRLLDRLHSSGLVSRARDESDRRVVRISLAEPGNQLLKRLKEPLQELLDDLMSPLGQAELRDLSRLLVLARSEADTP